MGIALGFGIIFGVRGVEGSPAGVLPVIALLIATAVVSRETVRNLCLIAVVGCVLGTATGLRVPNEGVTSLAAAPDGIFAGVIQSDPAVWDSGVMTHLAWQSDDGNERLSTLFMPSAPVAGRGDRIEVFGQIDGAGGELIFADGIRIVERAGWIELRRRAIRNYLTAVVQQRVPGTPGALTLGLLIGDDTALTDDERQDLRRAGLSHLTAVSGWNVMLVTSMVGLIFLKLGLRGWGWATLQLAALAGFVWIVGLEPPVTRAAIMAVAALVAIRLGRPSHSVTVLTLSAALMVAVSPSALSSLSFQLSVLATLGLVLAARMTVGLDGWRAVIVTPLVATGTAGIITAPLLAAEFGTLSLLTVPANMLAAPIVPAATFAGIVVVATSPAAPLAAIAGWAAWLISAVLLWLARSLASVPYAYHEFAPLSDVTQAAIYASLLVTVGLILPEGRLIVRAASNWMRDEPGGAALSAGAACVALVTVALAV